MLSRGSVACDDMGIRTVKEIVTCNAAELHEVCVGGCIRGLRAAGCLAQSCAAMQPPKARHDRQSSPLWRHRKRDSDALGSIGSEWRPSEPQHPNAGKKKTPMFDTAGRARASAHVCRVLSSVFLELLWHAAAAGRLSAVLRLTTAHTS